MRLKYYSTLLKIYPQVLFSHFVLSTVVVVVVVLASALLVLQHPRSGFSPWQHPCGARGSRCGHEPLFPRRAPLVQAAPAPLGGNCLYQLGRAGGVVSGMCSPYPTIAFFFLSLRFQGCLRVSRAVLRAVCPAYFVEENVVYMSIVVCVFVFVFGFVSVLKHFFWCLHFFSIRGDDGDGSIYIHLYTSKYIYEVDTHISSTT